MKEKRSRFSTSIGILLVLCLVAAFFYQAAQLDAERLYSVDTGRYFFEADEGFTSLERAVSSVRSFGYPLFLRLFVQGHESAGPYIQLAIFFFGVWVYFLGLVRCDLDPWWAAVAALAVALDPTATFFAETLMTESVACSLVLISVGLALWIVGQRSKSWLLYGALSLAVFLSYQVRPAVLFIVPLIPLLGALIALFRDGDVRRQRLRPWKTWLQPAVRLAIATVVPLLAFSFLRLVLVGHFGLVSFGGINLIGLTSSMLTEDVVAELPSQDRQLARHILEERQAKGYTAFQDITGLDWRQRIQQHVLPQYNINIKQFAIPEARRIAWQEATSKTEVRVSLNQQLSRLSRSIIRQRPWVYGELVAQNYAFGLRSLLFRPVLNFTNWFYYLWIPLLVVFAARTLQLLLQGPAAAPWKRLGTSWWIPGLIGLLFFASGLLLVVLVEPAINRYVILLRLFLPGGALVALLACGRAILQDLASLRSRPVS